MLGMEIISNNKKQKQNLRAVDDIILIYDDSIYYFNKSDKEWLEAAKNLETIFFKGLIRASLTKGTSLPT